MNRIIDVLITRPLAIIEGLFYVRYFMLSLWLLAPGFHISTLVAGLWGTDYAKYAYALIALIISVPGLIALFKKSWSKARRHHVRKYTSGLGMLYSTFLGVLEFTVTVGSSTGWTSIIMAIVFFVIYLHVVLSSKQ